MPALSRALLAIGLGALILGLGVLGLTVVGRGRLFGVWTGGLVAVVLLGLTAVVLPFALAVSWRRL